MRGPPGTGAAVIEELQQLAESLARRVELPVAIDDIHFRMLAYSAYGGPGDPVRTSAILAREPSAEVASYVRQWRLSSCEGPTRIPANPHLELLARVAVPIRCEGIHFGYLWIIDPAQALGADALHLATDTADQAGVCLFRAKVSRELNRARGRELLRDLLSDVGSVREAAAVGLVEASLFAPSPHAVVLCARPAGGGPLLVDDGAQLALGRALDAFADRLPPRHCLTLLRPDHAIALLSHDQPHWHADAPELLRRELAAARPSAGLVVGVGAVVPALAQAHESYRKALQALKVGRARAAPSGVARWDELGVYRLLVELPVQHLLAGDALPTFADLQRREPQLLPTVEAFLDSPASTQDVADALGVHRATVYHRLRRFEELTGLNLAQGEDRLLAHLSLKLQHLSRAPAHLSASST